MTGKALVPAEPEYAVDAAIQVVLDGLPSEHSRRAYRRALLDFFTGTAARSVRGSARP